MTGKHVSSIAKRLRRRATMKKYLVAAVLAVAVAALASVAFGSTKSPARTSSAASASSAATATVTGGRTRSIGLAAPFTGPAADIGNQQVRWAKYYVKRTCWLPISAAGPVNGAARPIERVLPH